MRWKNEHCVIFCTKRFSLKFIPELGFKRKLIMVQNYYYVGGTYHHSDLCLPWWSEMNLMFHINVFSEFMGWPKVMKVIEKVMVLIQKLFFVENLLLNRVADLWMILEIVESFINIVEISYKLVKMFWKWERK